MRGAEEGLSTLRRSWVPAKPSVISPKGETIKSSGWDEVPGPLPAVRTANSAHGQRDRPNTSPRPQSAPGPYPQSLLHFCTARSGHQQPDTMADIAAKVKKPSAPKKAPSALGSSASLHPRQLILRPRSAWSPRLLVRTHLHEDLPAPFRGLACTLQSQPSSDTATCRRDAAHPPFVAMITEAIKALKERGGSSSVAIAKVCS